MENFYDSNAELDDNRMDIETRVYVQNIPEELNEIAIKEVFCQYGNIVDMYHPRNATWAYITYGTYREAEHAIRALYDNKSLGLKVALAKRSSNETQNLSVSQDLEKKEVLATDVAKPLSTHTDTKYCSRGRGQGAISKYSTMSQGAIPKYSTMLQKGIPYVDNEPSSSSYSHASNVYESEDKFENTSRLWAREIMTTLSDGKRHVAAGRGYIAYEYPDENPKTEEFIGKIYEKRLKGLYKYGEQKLEDIQKCYTCSIKTTRHCVKCSTYYCSRSCQEKDWPRHRKECESIPALVEDTVQNVSTLQISKEEEQEKRTLKPNAIHKAITSNDIKLRRPNTPQNLTNTQNNSINVSKTEKVDQLINSAVTKDTFQQNQRFKYNSTAGNTDQPKGDEGYQKPRYNNITGSTDQSKGDHGYQRPRYNNIAASTDQSKGDDGYQRPRYNNTIRNTEQSKGDEGYQRPKYNNTARNTDQSKENEGYSTKANSIRQNYNRGQNATNRTSYDKDRVDNTNIRDRNYNVDDKNQSDQRYGFQNNRKFSPCNSRQNANKRRSSASSNSNTDEDLAFNKDTYLSNKEFTEVKIIVPLNNNEYWIIKIKDVEALKNLMETLHDVAEKLNTVKPNIGKIYGVLYKNQWRRAKVISVNPVMVHYIDFGNEEILKGDAEILKDIGDVEQLKVPKFAKKIQLTPAEAEKYKNLQYNDTIFVRMLSMKTDGTIIVEVQKQLKDSSVLTKESAPQSDTNNAMEKTMQQEKFEMPQIISTKASKIEVFDILDAFTNLLTEKAVTELEFKGLIHIVEFTQTNVYCASLIPDDYNTEFGMLLNELQHECNNIGKCINNGSQIEDLVCGNASNGEDGWFRGYVLTSSDLRIIVVDEARILPVDQILPCPEKFLNICAFGVVCEGNHSKLVLGETYGFSTMINQQSCKQGNFKIDITVGDEVVTALIKPWETRITKSIPALAEIKSGSKQRSCSAKIVLKDVPRDVPMTVETDRYLRNLTGQEVPLKCVYEGTPSKDGVYLTTSTGEKVNDELNKSLVPSWERQEDNDFLDNGWLSLDDIKTASLGRVGDTVKVGVTHVRDVGKQYMLSPLDKDAWHHHDNVMLPMMKEFCEKTEYYIPRENELCLALYLGAWYRAACLKPKDTDTTSEIFFIDYGNIDLVKHQNIRKMPKDFLTPVALANLCIVVDLEPFLNADKSSVMRQKIKELTCQGSEVEIKIVEDDGLIYKVEFLDVYAKLKSGNFI